MEFGTHMKLVTSNKICLHKTYSHIWVNIPQSNQFDGWQVQHAMESRHVNRVLTGKSEGNRPLVKPWP